MKKILETTLGLICIFALVLGGAENPDGSCNFIWTISCLSVSGLCAWALTKLEKKQTK